MANIIELRDSANEKAYPRTKAQAVYFDDGLTLDQLEGIVKPCRLGLRLYTKYPNVDTTNQTITFYAGTCVLDYTGTEIYRATEDVVVNLYTSGQINKIVFDKTESKFYAYAPTNTVYKNTKRYVDLGLISRAHTAGYAGGKGWISIPHTIDGHSQNDQETVLPTTWANTVQTIQEAQGKKFIFAIQTDTHFSINDITDGERGNNLKLLTNYIGLDFVANLGDIIRGYADETIDTPANSRASLTELIKRYVTGISCPFIVAMGNHDTNNMWANAFSGTAFSFDEVWGRAFKPAFNTNPKAVTETGLMYYYVDFNDVRVIVLNTQDGSNGGFGIGTDQVTWLTNTALNTDKAVLVTSHVPLVDGWSISSNYDSSYANAVAAIKTFKNNGGTVIGCMSGHIHTQETQTVDGILYVTFKNGSDLCEVVMVDLDNKSINTVPLGFTGVGNRTFSYT